MDPEHHRQGIWGDKSDADQLVMLVITCRVSVRNIHIEVEAILIASFMKTTIGHPAQCDIDFYLRTDLILCKTRVSYTGPGVRRNRGVETKVTKRRLGIWDIL